MKNKIIYLLTLLITVLTLSACSASITNNGTIDATTNISWSGDKKEIVASTVTIKCNDNYYGVVVNDSINFNNDNNYFTTGNGLLIQITDNQDSLVSNNSTYSYKATIEDDVSLYVSGNDEEKIKEVFNGVYKTNKESYQMFSRDINQEWTQNVIITSDVVSFSNGTDTTYIYQNEGSLSPGSFEGKVEPTVFKKQLRGIDIPITYPEDIEGVSNYIPYGAQTYEHWTNEGYTPYSAYTISIEYWIEQIYNETNFSYSTVYHNNSEDMTNFIILANNDESVLNLFEEKNDHIQSSYTLKPSKVSLSSSITCVIADLSSVRDIATSVINSDNRYHFGVLSKYDTYATEWSETNTDGYYVDNYTALREEYNNFKIAGGMNGKLVIPTIKYAVPTYDSNDEGTHRTLENFGTFYDYFQYGISEAMSSDFAYATYEDINIFDVSQREREFLNHGAYVSFEDMMTTNNRFTFGWHNYILEGDYIYFYSSDNQLYIFKNIITDTRVEEDKTNHLPTMLTVGDTGIDELDEIISESGSCFGDAENNLGQLYTMESLINYDN